MLAERKLEVNNDIRNFQTILWRERGQPRANREILKSFDIIEAIEFLGYKVHECELIPGGGIGYLNKPAKQVLVKSNLSKQRKLYTLAHELSHILLHKDMDVLHREEHFKNNQYRPKIESEADYGASLFLMPEKVVRSEFKKRFLSDQLVFNENVVFHLIKNPRERDAALNAEKPKLREYILSKAIEFNYVKFDSLADYFGVSVESMAIRLEDLELVGYP